MNVELLLKVKDYILAHPAELAMLDWVCGTQACIAGHAVCLTYEKQPAEFRTSSNLSNYLYRVGRTGIIAEVHRLFGFEYSPGDRTQLDNLLYLDAWPAKFYDSYCAVETNWERAAVTAERIQFFIDTNGTDELEQNETEKTNQHGS
jgi:hypothetical protein